MGSYEFITFISTLAYSISQNKTQEEVELLALFFTQLEKSAKDTNIIHTFVLNNFIQTYHEKASRTYLYVTGLRL